MRVRTADGVTIDVSTNDRDEAARVAHQAYLRRQEAPSGINRPRSAIRGTAAGIVERGGNEERARTYGRETARRLGLAEVVPGVAQHIPDFFSGDRAELARRGETLAGATGQAVSDVGDFIRSIGDLPVYGRPRAGEERLSPYERLRLTGPERQARIRELAQRAERQLLINQGYTPEQAAAPVDEFVVTAPRRNVLSPELRQQLPRNAVGRAVNDAGHVAANVGHAVTADLPRFWGDVGEASWQRRLDTRGLARGVKIAQEEGRPEIAQSVQPSLNRASLDSAPDNLFGLLEATPAGIIGSAAVSAARVAGRNALQLARREIPQALRAPVRRSAEETGPLTREGSKYGLGAGAAATGGGAMLLAPGNAAAATPDPDGGYRVRLPDGRVVHVDTDDRDEAVRVATRLIPNESAGPIIGGAIGSMVLSALMRRALPRTPRIGAALGAAGGGAAGGVAAGGGFKSDEDAMLGAGAGATQFAVWELGALLSRMRSGVRLTPAQQARVAELEVRLGRLTEGQRTGNIDQLQLEDQLRSGHVGDRAAATMLTHDAEAGRELQQNAMDIVARGQEPLTSDLGDAGRQYVETMRTTREAMRETADTQYATAMDLARSESLPAGLNRMPSAAIEEAAYAGDFAVPPSVQHAVARLEAKIKDGAATHETVERTRQELNALLREASFRRGADERHISNAIGALDEWQSNADVLRNPKARAAMTEARAMWEEQARLFEPQGRSQSATGHTLRSDVAGRAMDRLINEETTGRQALDTALGSGFASSRGEPGRQALGITRRTRAIGARALKYTNRNAPSGIRVPGRMSLGEDDWSALDMNTDRSQRFVADRTMFRRLGQLLADGLDNEAINATMRREGLSEENLGHIIRQIRDGRLTRARLPAEELQTLREGAWHKVMEPLSDYLRAVETSRVQGAGFLPAQRLVSQLDNALNKGGREVMEALYTKNEVREMRDLLEHMGRLILPHGVSRSGSNVWLKHFGAALMNFIRHIPLAGPVIGVVGDMAAQGNAVRQAQRAIRPPRRANLPRITPGAAAIGVGAAAGGGGLLAANEAYAQERSQEQSQELLAQETRVRELEADQRFFSEFDASSPESVRALQRRLGVAVDGRAGPETRPAVEARKRQIEADLTRERAVLAGMQQDEAMRRTEPSGLAKAVQEWGPNVGFAAGAYLAHGGLPIPRRLPLVGRFSGFGGRESAVREVTEEIAARNKTANARLPPRGRPVPRGGSNAAAEERTARATQMNAFWGQGGAGYRVPFDITPDKHGFTVRPNAMPAARLFQPRLPPGLREFHVNDLGVMAAAGLDSGFIEIAILPEARKEEAEAEAEQKLDPGSVEKRRRLNAARENVARLEFLSRAGLGYIGGRLMAPAFKHTRYPTTRPGVQRAEQEVMELNRFLAPRPQRLPRRAPE